MAWRSGVLAALGAAIACPALADGNIHAVKHIIIVMQENHSFDNYFGVLPFAPGSPYHPPAPGQACAASDHHCVDGLTCAISNGALVCSNRNLDSTGAAVIASHAATRCAPAKIDHSWDPSHHEVNLTHPNHTLTDPLNDGFVVVNEPVSAREPGATMLYFDQNDIPFYYDLASKFAISDRAFSSLIGPTVPNRMYSLAATSFGHVTTNDAVPPHLGFGPGYQPITGTIFDLLDKFKVSWTDYGSDFYTATLFRSFAQAHLAPSGDLERALAGEAGYPLPQVAFADPNFGALTYATETDEHPPSDIQRGQAHVSRLVNALRNGPHWKDTVMFITWDEHGGFYDHVPPPAAPQAGRTPDGIFPGQCADASNLPASGKPGGGQECSWNWAHNFNPAAHTSVQDAEALCPALAANPTGPFPPQCAAFDQLGLRVGLIAVSPFAKPSYVSHSVSDHTSLLAFIEARFLTTGSATAHLTSRDANANTLESLFDFDDAPSAGTLVSSARRPADDCTPTHGRQGEYP